ncbi:MAG: zinc-ribbon domain containing protein [Oscillospiraceae bacterium]|nr:zinc-ribbon domain containing protein [Oscillospiraceae bacterium]MDD3260877.1 zinc-ribbon domain containing protein [Oscillospiraceae bacterium]
MYQDKTLICKDCGKEFVFSAGEQEFYAEKGFINEPCRCKECRAKRKQGGQRRTERPERKMYSAVCASCGKETKVPFQPQEGRPVYCAECFAKMRRK